MKAIGHAVGRFGHVGRHFGHVGHGPVGKALTLAVLMLLLTGTLAATGFAAQDAGRIEGTVTRAGGDPIRGVSVVVEQLGLTRLTDRQGSFRFDGVPAGTYTVTFILGERRAASEVTVEAGQTAEASQTVDWEVGYGETITVTSVSRHPEKITEAPAAVTVIGEEEIERQASHGQLPGLLEFTPGAEVTQSGIYDYNLNTRGFNSSLNRRVATLIDGRDPSVPFLGAQEWAAISFPLDNVTTMEFVRGPSAALYGANASSGVLNVMTKQPRFNQGGLLRVAGGELESANVDFLWAGDLGGGWYGKLNGGYRHTDDWALSRNGFAEYSVPCPRGVSGDCLPQEAVPLAEDKDDIWFGSARADKYLDNGIVLTFEGGLADVSGPVFQTGIGRVQVVDVQRPWARFNASTDRWNVLAYWNRRDAPRQLALASGANLVLDSDNIQVEGQANWDLGQDARLVVGGSFGHETIDTFDEDLGRQTLMFEPVDSQQGSAYAQVGWNVTDRLRLVGAGRVDESTLHETRFSPKAAAVFHVDPQNSIRASYTEAFQVANYSEFFLQAPVAPPVNLAPLNAFCAPFGVDCGFGITPILAVGNEDLEVEEIRTFEVGYAGLLGDRARVTVDVYRSNADNFITDLLPQLGTTLGRINPNFGAWEGPEGLPAFIEAAIRQAVPLLTNNFDGSNILVAASYTNFGEVDTQGVDLGVNYFGDSWTGSFTYSFFDFEIERELPGFGTLLLPNSPEHKASGGFSYFTDRWDASASLRWVDDFRWAVGPFQGLVESYTVVNVTGNFQATPEVGVGVNVSNLFDNEHWESFGGDLLGRRALVYVSYGW